jgi:hypothetical protein
VLVALDDGGVEAALEQVADAVVAMVEGLGVAEAEEVHPAREPFELGRDDEVEVVRHVAEREQAPAEPARRATKERGEEAVVGVVGVDGLACDAAVRHVVAPGGRKVGAGPAWHRRSR